MASNRKSSNQKRTSGGRAASSTSVSTAARRTGAGSTRKPPRPSAKAAAAKTGRPGRPSVADAKAFAVAPYADRPRGKQARKEARERKKRMYMIPGAPAVIRGGWPGFLVLFFGEGANLLLTGGNGFILLWIAVIAYAVAGNRAAVVSLDSTPRAVRDGALAGALAFLITVPLRFLGHTGQALVAQWWALVFELIVGLVIGGFSALIVARARHKSAPVADG